MTSDKKQTTQGSMLKHTDEEVLTQRDQPKTTHDTVRAFKTKLTNAEGDIQQTSFKTEEVHDQLDYMGVKILSKERPATWQRRKPRTKRRSPEGELGSRGSVRVQRFQDGRVEELLKNSNEEGNWSYMREDSSQKGDAEAQRQRASQGQ